MLLYETGQIWVVEFFGSYSKTKLGEEKPFSEKNKTVATT